MKKCGKAEQFKLECPNQLYKFINCIRAKVGNTDHQASDPKCPMFIRHKEIHKLMAVRELTFRDNIHDRQRGVVYNGGTKRFSVLP